MLLPASSDPGADKATSKRYAYTPRAFGRAITLDITDQALIVDDTVRVQKFPLHDIVAARLTFEPTNTMGSQFSAKLIVRGGRSLKIKSRHMASFALSEDRRVAYAAFLRALLPAIASANPSCDFRAGRSMPIWLLLAALSLVCTLGIIAMLIQAVRTNGWAIIAVLTMGGALLVYVMAEMVRRNRPRAFDPANPPQDVLG